MSTPSSQAVLDRVRGEYLEMPGMRLTLQQVQRLCGIERTLCRAILESLVEARFLYVSPGGLYARATEGPMARPRAARMDLETRTPLERAS